MTEPTRSIPDVAEELMHEFQSVCAVSAVTQVVIRLSRDGAVSLSELAELARSELSMLATGRHPRAVDVPSAVAP